jgi:hypothetical protein
MPRLRVSMRFRIKWLPQGSRRKSSAGINAKQTPRLLAGLIGWLTGFPGVKTDQSTA